MGEVNPNIPFPLGINITKLSLVILKSIQQNIMMCWPLSIEVQKQERISVK